MKARQQNTVNMMNLVITVCEKAIAIIAGIAELQSSYTSFKSIVSSILDTAKEQMVELKGIATVKSNLKNSLARSAVKVAAAIKAFAHKNKMFDLEEEMSYTERALFKLTDLNIQKVASHIFDKATLHAAEIVNFGITSADITKLSADIKSFSLHYNDPTAAIEMRKHYTTKLDKLISDASDILNNEMDPLMKVLSFTDADFYDIYKNSRNIIDRHGKTREHKIEEGIGTIYVTSTATIDGSFLENVKVDLIQNSVVIDTAYTDENGEAILDNVKAGTYIVELNQETFNPKQSDEFKLIPGDELSLELSMDASFD
jgi:hypothetical protein